MPFSAFPNEIYGILIELLREDPYSLRTCSLVSSVFRHFCEPILYQDLSLDSLKKVDSFIQVGKRSHVLHHIKSLSLTDFEFETDEGHEHTPHKILDIISRKASLETLHLGHVQFHPKPLEVSVLSSTVTVLILEMCHFGGFKAFKHFIGCFPRCEALRLHGSTHSWFGEWVEQREIVETYGLGHMNLKSFAYAVDDSSSTDMLEEISACELLEEIDVSFPRSTYAEFDSGELAVIVRS
jgi:hypothetical protein